jgi:hypothetical protein
VLGGFSMATVEQLAGAVLKAGFVPTAAGKNVFGTAMRLGEGPMKKLQQKAQKALEADDRARILLGFVAKLYGNKLSVTRAQIAKAMGLIAHSHGIVNKKKRRGSSKSPRRRSRSSSKDAGRFLRRF